MTLLVLSLLEEYARAFEGLWELLEPGGRFLVVDAHAERLGFQVRMVNLTARADIRRRVWEPLEAVAQGFRFERATLSEIKDGAPGQSTWRPV